MDFILAAFVITLGRYICILSLHLSWFLYTALVTSSSKFCIVTAMCRMCPGEHHFPAIGGIMYITSYSYCETQGFVWISHFSPYLYPVYVDFPVLSYPKMSMTSTVSCHPWWWHSIFSWLLQEEDLVELCVGLGQAHPDSVFQISETKALLTFWSTAKMMAATHLLCAAMAWHDKPIRLHTHPLTNTHLRDYVAVRGTCPSSTPTLTPGGEIVPSLPLVNPTLKIGPPQFQMAIRDLGDAQLRHLMEDLWQEATHRELNVSSTCPPLGH